jgi:hypothetical protein
LKPKRNKPLPIPKKKSQKEEIKIQESKPLTTENSEILSESKEYTVVPSESDESAFYTATSSKSKKKPVIPPKPKRFITKHVSKSEEIVSLTNCVKAEDEDTKLVNDPNKKTIQKEGYLEKRGEIGIVKGY